MSKVRLFANGLGAWRAELIRELGNLLRPLGSSASIDVLDDDDGDIDPGELVLYFSQSSDDATVSKSTATRLRRHLDAGGHVIPVLDKLEDVTEKLPAPLHDCNGYAVAEQASRDYSRLLDEILSRLWWRRRGRRIFLSYKRSESSGVAHQLRDELTRRGWQVFLDECTLSPGDAVQREIMSWLTDADFALLLCSPKLHESQWVMDEVATANSVLLPILGLIWPGATPPSALFPDEHHELTALEGTDPAEQTLSEHDRDTVLEVIESYRARGIYRRLENLLPYFRSGVASRFEVRDAEALGDLEIEDPDRGELSFVRVLPFRPTVAELHDLNRDLVNRRPAPERAYIFYAENDLHDPARGALAWALEPDRAAAPRRYRLLSLLDGRGDLGDLAS